MADNKTKRSAEAVAAFLDRVPDPQMREDAKALAELVGGAVGETPHMWGSSIIGFGRYQYRYESGREGEAAAAGFSPRSKEIVIYLPAHSERTGGLLKQLGKHRAGKSCVYIKRLTDVDERVLRELILDSYKEVKARYPGKC